PFRRHLMVVSSLPALAESPNPQAAAFLPAGAGQRQRGVPRAGDLANRLLSLAPTAGTLRGRRRAPAPAARPVATAPEVERLVLAIAISAATLGVPTDRGLPGADLAG